METLVEKFKPDIDSKDNDGVSKGSASTTFAICIFSFYKSNQPGNELRLSVSFEVSKLLVYCRSGLVMIV